MDGKYKISESNYFVNPYNFVSVDLENTKRFDITKEKEEKFTGYLQCYLKCRTPIAIPDVKNANPITVKEDGKAKIHYQYPFMGMEQEKTPCIPGSSIRGPIRNVFETLTNSCFGTMKSDTLITSRDTLREKGLLIKENGKWKLYRAERHLLVIDKKFHETHNLSETEIQLYSMQVLSERTGEKIRFQLADNPDPKKNVYEKEDKRKGRKWLIGTYVKNILPKESNKGTEGYLCIGEKSQNRHFQSVFEKKELEASYNITDLDIQKLEYVIECYRNDKINTKYNKDYKWEEEYNNQKEQKNHKGYSDYETSKNKEGVIPIYYTLEGKKLYMSPAAMGRKAYYNTLNDVVKEKSHQKCNDRNNLCPACTLFGTIEGKGIGSRVRFTDATCTNYSPDKMIKKVVFDELSSPRMSYIPFYLKERVKKTNYTKGYDSADLEIRGRKFYWHHKPMIEKNGSIPRTDRNATFDLLDENTEFSFRVYFDSITDVQLSHLASAIHLYENDINGDMCHKIGHGKPLGYGSVKIIVDKCVVRTFDLKRGWKVETKEIDKHDSLCSDTTMKELLTIYNFNQCKYSDATVEYPCIVTDDETKKTLERKKDKNSLARHKWFTENYKVGNARSSNSFQKLPIITENQKLKKYEFFFEESNNRNQRGNSQSGINQNGIQDKYRAKVLSPSIAGRNPNFVNYNIEILDSKDFSGENCTMSAHVNCRIQMNQIVEVELYKDTRFNYKGR